MTSARSPRIAIVGAGFGGIGMAIALQQAGIERFEVFERAERIGGVWRENTYPGAGCDIPSPFYSFSFEPNPRWPWRYSKQPSILAYLEHCVAKYAIADRIRLGGGVERFGGHSFHSAHWDHDHDLTGKRVAVIGTGASAIQFVPEIAPAVAELHLFQRSAPFVVPKPDRFYSDRRHAMFERFPALLSAERLGWFLVCEYGQVAMSDHPGWLTPVATLAQWHLRHAVKDPVKRKLLEPDDQLGCKRLLFSNAYYPALARDNVEIIGEGVVSIREHAVTTGSGLTREVDTIIYATGYATHGFVAPMQVTGVGGSDLADGAWCNGASAYLGITVPDFPNLFLLYGPNTNLGTGSIVHMLESQIRYVSDAVGAIARAPGTAFSVRRGPAELYDAEIQRRLAGSVWASGCVSWYVDANGRNANNWPGTMSEYRWRTRQFDPEDYEALEPGHAPAPVQEASLA